MSIKGRCVGTGAAPFLRAVIARIAEQMFAGVTTDAKWPEVGPKMTCLSRTNHPLTSYLSRTNHALKFWLVLYTAYIILMCWLKMV